MAVSVCREGIELGNPFTWYRANTPFIGMPPGAVLPIGSLSGLQYYADDFLRWLGPNTAGEAGGWALTETAAGVGNAQRVDIAEALGGYLKILTDNGANDLENLQMVGEPFKYVVGKRMWFFAKLQVDDITKTKILVGLAITDTSLIASAPSDGIWFQKATFATGALDFVVSKASTATTNSNIATLVNTTDLIVGFTIDATGNVVAYAGSSVDRLNIVAIVAAGQATLPNTQTLALSLSVQTSEATAHNMMVDWLTVAQEI